MHALSIDGDDQVLAAAQLRARRLPAGYRPHVERDLAQTLELLGALDVSATFFVNAQYFPKDVSPLERIVSAGHRLGSHSFLHRNVRRQSLAEFREDVKWSLDLLLPVQASIPGYRPPGFTMPCQERYFTVLTEPGFQLHLGGYRFEQRTRAECRGSNVGGRRPPARADLKHWSWRRHHGSNWLLRRLAIAAGKPLLGARRAMAAGEAFFHYYAHTFELAGIEGLAYPGPWHPIPALYRVRMRDRRRLYERLTQRARFVSIEEVISLDAADT